MKKYLILLMAAVLLAGHWSCDDKEGTVAVTSVTVAPETVSIIVGTSATVTATVLPEAAANREVMWTTNSPVATVNRNGVITGIALGTATIIATTMDGGHTATVAVTVTEAPIFVTGVTVNLPAVTIEEGASATVTATVLPSDATNKGVIWTSNATNIATVNEGVITGVAAGDATITVTTVDGGHTATVAVTVEKPITITKVWGKTATDIGLTVNAENSIAVCGDYLVFSRTGICLNKADGSVASGKTLNVTGITGSQAINIFFLFNDSKGNMLGATLPAWSSAFNIYKWTSVDANPIPLYSGAASEGAARKMAAIGDINGNAFIYDQVPGDVNGPHKQWAVVSGVLQSPPTTINTGIPSNDGYSNWQTLIPLDETANPSYFLVDPINGGSNVHYRDNDGIREVQPSALRKHFGSETPNYYGAKEWGNYRTNGGTAFWFNGKAYGVILTEGVFASITSIIDATTDHNVSYVEVVEHAVSRETQNGNNTAGACYEIASDAKSVRIYTLFTSESVSCYEMSID